MVDSTLRNERGERVRANYPSSIQPDGAYKYDDVQGTYGQTRRKPDKTPEQLQEEREGAIEKGKDYAEKYGDYAEKLKKFNDDRRAFDTLKKAGESFKGKKPIPTALGADVAWWILNPPVDPDTMAPDWEMPPYPNPGPPKPPYPQLPSICGTGNIRIKGKKYKPGMPRYMIEYRVFMTDARDPGLYTWSELPTIATFIMMDTDGQPLKQPKLTGGVAGVKNKGTHHYTTFIQNYEYRAYWSQATSYWPGTDRKYVSPVISSVINPPREGDGYDGYGIVFSINGSPYEAPGWMPYLGNFIPWSEKICEIELIYDDEEYEPVEPNDYDRAADQDDPMPCQWQKDEVDYTLPELKIGDSTVGGNSIRIDDGLIPLANFLCKSIEMIHGGLGLNHLGTELPKLVSDRGGTKIKPSSLAELTQWQFDNVSSLVGLPVETAITNLENSTKDIVFRNVQDCISFMFQQQKESDLDLMVIENYCTRIAQQLEAVTQISLRQQADIEMLVKELGFRWKWETKTRKSLYKIGMSDEDEKTGILELFKGGEVSYPVRVWDDKLDSRQIAMTTNLYSEIASKSNFHSFNSNSPIPGLDARSKMSKTNEEDWKEWVKGINTPEKGTISGGTTPYIEEYSQASITAKNVAEPASGLSLFMKPKKAKVTGPK